MDKAIAYRVVLFGIIGMLLGTQCTSRVLASTASNATERKCPPWFIKNETTQECACSGDLEGVVRCKEATREVWLNLKFCMTYDSESGNTLVGECPFSALQKSSYGDLYALLPNNITLLNDSICGRANREGLLCSKCKPGYGPPAFLYNVKCMPCSQSGRDLLLFLLLTCIPTTFFFLVIVTCQVRTTSAPLNAFIIGAQFIAIATKAYPQELSSSSESNKIIFYTIISFLSLWNLDFLPFVVPSLCVSENLSNLQLLSMEYIGAFFPLVLIICTYVCIQQHARGCILLVCLWKPFGYCLTPLMKRFGWNPAESMVHVFVSYLLLSSTKILFVSFNLLKTTRLYTNVQENVYEHSPLLFYDTSIVFFSKEHLPYAFLAIAITTLFVLLPCLILLLYPTKPFQKCLNRCGIRWHALHVFADAFNGCYKNGTNGTHDYRSFAGYYLLLRFCFVVIELTPYTEYDTVRSVLAIIALLTFALASPYKVKFFNIIDSLWIAFTALILIAGPSSYKAIMYLFCILVLTTYFIAYVSCQIVFKLKFPCSQRLKAFADKVAGTTGIEAHSPNLRSQCDIEESFPHRVLNPEEYDSQTVVDVESQQLITQSTKSSVPTYGIIE